jgi:hypothetical protein
LTQSTDEFFFTASNQIVKDLRSRPRNCERPERLRASSLSQPQARIATPVASKLVNLKKNRTGRPYSARSGGPEQVLLPFLTEDLFPYTTVARLWQIPPANTHSKRAIPKIPNWRPVQNIRVFPHDARGFAKKNGPYDAGRGQSFFLLVNGRTIL